MSLKIPLMPEWILITGAASGIGAQLSQLFARDGSNLVLIDKNAAALSEFSAKLETDFAVQTIPLVLDLSLPETPQNIFNELQTRKIDIDILVNNAGFGTYGEFWEIDIDRDRALVNLNILAPMLLTKLFLPGMVARKRGAVLNVGSISGFLASPHATTYYSSKAWLLSFSQGLSTSLRGSGVSVSIVCPGPTATAFNWHDPDSGSPAPRKPFQMDASEVALQAYRGMRRGQMIIIPGASNQFLALLAKILPRKVALWITTVGQNSAN